MLAFANFAASADKAVVAVYAPELRTTFHLTDAQTGSLQGGPFVIGYILALLWAGRRTTMPANGGYVAACIAIWTLGAALFALAPGFPELLAGRLVLAIGQAAFAPAAILLLNAGGRYDAGRGASTGASTGPGGARFLSLFTASSTVGRSAGLMLGGVLLGAAGGLSVWLPDVAAWRLSGLAMLLPNLMLLSVFLRSREIAIPPVPSRGVIQALRHIGGRARPVLSWTIAGCGMIVVVQACAAWAPSILHRQFDLAVGTSGIVVGVVTLIAAPLGHLGAGWIMSSSRAPVDRAGLLLAAAAVLSAVFAVVVAASTVELWTVMALAGLMAAGGFGAALVLIRIQPLFPGDLQRSANSLYFAAVTIVGSAAGPAITGLISDHVAPDGGQLPLALAMVTAGAGSVVVLAALLSQTVQAKTSLGPRA
jgi:MFS family permease